MIKISDEYWNDLEITARSAVVAGGFAAMGYYRGALATAAVLEQNLSPSTIADVQATLAIMRSLDPAIRFISGKLSLGFSLFAEELEIKLTQDESPDEREIRVRRIFDQLGGVAANIKRSTLEFQDSFDTCIAILFDALDGTTNFRAGIPLFCSAIAFFIRGVPRVGAIYDPLHNVVYYGSLRDSERHAYAWQVQSGSVSNLVDIKNRQEGPTKLIATHLTRSKEEKRNKLMESLGELTKTSEGTYMLNSGQLALAYIANGNLSVFVNNYTNIWDIAAGEVLIRAVGGKVTDFKGKDIDYSTGPKIDIVASLKEDLHEEVIQILGREHLNRIEL